MPIERTDASNNWTYLWGVVDADTPQPLGPTSSVFSVVDPKGKGTHYGALYQPRPSTTLLKLYFEPNRWVKRDLGYVQFCQLKSFGRVVPPEVVPALTSRRSYSNDFTRGTYLEFMGPTDAAARLLGGPCEFPFYALNASLLRQFTPLADYETFCWHPMPNGSIRSGDDMPELNPSTKPSDDARRSKCASLVLHIAPFMLTQDALALHCTDDNLLLDEKPDAGTTSFYHLVLQLCADESDQTPDSRVIDVQAVGACLLITLDDGEEGEGGTVLVAAQGPVPNQPGKRHVRVWQIDRDTFAGIEHNATLEMLRSLAGWLANKKPNLTPVNRLTSRRGWSGLNRPPDIVYWPGELLTLDLISMVGTEAEFLSKGTWFSGVRTRLTWGYDAVAECLNVTELKKDVPFSVNPLELSSVLACYRGSLRSQPSNDVALESAFTIAGSPWYDDAPPYP